MAANSTETYQATFNTLEAMSNFEQYKYAKLQMIGVAQDAVNFPDEPGKCYVTIGYGNKSVDTNVEISDSVKIFKNVGASFFKYLPINAITRQTYFTSGSQSEIRYVSVNQFNDTDVLKDYQAKWRLPFKLFFKNATSKERKFRVITKVILKGREAEGLTRFIAEQIKQAKEEKVMVDQGCDPIDFKAEVKEIATNTNEFEDCPDQFAVFAHVIRCTVEDRLDKDIGEIKISEALREIRQVDKETATKYLKDRDYSFKHIKEQDFHDAFEYVRNRYATELGNLLREDLCSAEDPWLNVHNQVHYNIATELCNQKNWMKNVKLSLIHI